MNNTKRFLGLQKTCAHLRSLGISAVLLRTKRHYEILMSRGNVKAPPVIYSSTPRARDRNTHYEQQTLARVVRQYFGIELHGGDLPTLSLYCGGINFP